MWCLASPQPTSVPAKVLPPPIPRIAAVHSTSTKSRGIYIILALIFGFFGFHNFYANRIKVGFVQFFLSSALVAGALVTGFWILPAISNLWALIDALTVTKDGAGAQLA